MEVLATQLGSCSIIRSPRPSTQGRGAGGEGFGQTRCRPLHPSPQPLSPEFRGEGLQRHTAGRAFLACSLALACLSLSAGCFSDGFIRISNPLPVEEPCMVVATWNPQVVFTPDPTHGGTPTPGLASRVFLFGPQARVPVMGDGRLEIALYLRSPTTGKIADKPLEVWNIDKDTLKRVEKKDAFGWGYTLFLPWSTYKPEYTHVDMRLAYVPIKKGAFPLYADAAPLTLGKNNSQGLIPAANTAQPKS
jgi:hypothetical protein